MQFYMQIYMQKPVISICEKINNNHVLIIGTKIIYMAGKCPKRFQHLILNRLKITLHLIKAFKKNYNEKSEVGYILDVNVKYPKKIYKSHNDFPFLPERKKMKKMRSL